ncbi:uncharacterized protein osm isoform X2 [Ictalurus furcatus]|uniref:uncharacterized protein osm isoform X2 n=1 Tax=Ictalurus furcatus TaxID=66913 RepID=UPI002350C4FB|nr:uncharacterized protein osm isoform X2 [Ictalurus furcatus]
MKSTAGILTLCFVLSVNLCTLTAFPADLCRMEAILKRVKHEIQKLQSGLNIHVNHNGEIIRHLMINKSLPIPQQYKSAACGLSYMEKALEEIQKHQKLNNSEQIQKLFEDVINRLKTHLPVYARHTLGKCDNPPQLSWPESIFKAKQWTWNFLDSSEKFLRHLIHLLECREENP